MSESARIPTSGTRRVALPAVLERNGFPLGIAAITAVAAAFLFHQLLAWQPHEDEALALFVGRQPLGDLFRVVLEERGGAPLHFVLAWVVAHVGLGLGGLRAVSALFALASLPLVALLGVRLAGRRQALVATALVAASWTFLFHGVYGRMYSLFLFTSALSFLALLAALDRRDRRGWALWTFAILATVATHPYGALVLASQGAYVLLARRDRLRQALPAAAAVLVVGIPFWLTNLVLASRFDVGVGGGGAKLGGPWPVVKYLWRVLGDFTAGWWPLTVVAFLVLAAGVARLPRRTAILLACVVGVPALAFVAARLGNATSPETRHLIFALPFVALALAAGILRLGRAAPVAVAVLAVAQVAWTWERTPQLFEWEPSVRQAARAEAASYLAATSRPDDVLFGYEPLYLGAWERNPDFPLTALPRADAGLALATLQDLERPLGRGIWILDASDNNNFSPSLEIAYRTPEPRSAFETRRFGPFLVIRTAQPTLMPERYLERAAQAMLVGKALYLGDADINLVTIERAARELRGYGSSRSLSTSSR
ncbi:MAG: glycosyltransferase family 39 protein [Actinobacteria bacterium]|nr:glycosyltransferase family 39 protein [Actinomycetota bacterium]